MMLFYKFLCAKKGYLIIFGVVIIIGIALALFFSKKDNRQDESTEIVKASAEFKTDQYFRYEPAKKLVSHLKIGMTKQDVEALLGKPNKKYENNLLWDYTLGYSQFISVGFDPNGIVQKFGGAYTYMMSQEVK